MTSSNTSPPPELPDVTSDEGGLSAPPGLSYWGKVWWWFDFLILVKLARLRFIAILVAIGVVITQWDLLLAYYDRWTRPTTPASAVASNIEFFCPMHPSVVRDTGKEKCPICFMPLSKRKKGEQSVEALPAGVVNRVQLSPYRVVLAGVQRWEVCDVPLTKEIDAVGYVEFDEREVKTVSARVKGRLDELHINVTGQMVAAGDLLASLYSPDLNVTVQNLLDAQRRNSPQLVASSRSRLQLLGIGDDQINEILESGTANSHLRIRSPIGGHVIKKYVREGQYVEEGSPLFEIADLANVWIEAQIYEDDMAFLPLELMHEIRDPLPVTATSASLPGEVFRGKLTFIYPHVDPQSRTVTVRYELPNPGHKLRPGMAVNVTLLIPPGRVPILQQAAEHDPSIVSALTEGRVPAVPETAIIDTGRETIVYRETVPGTFEGVLVTLGPKMTGPENITYFPVLAGLERGDQIVTSGSFLVDAETRLSPAAGSIYFGGSSGSKSESSTVTTIRPTTPDDEDAKLNAALKRLAPADRVLAEQQKFCPILDGSRLGSMGVPVKVMVDGQPVFVCCPSCEAAAKNAPSETLKKVERLNSGKKPIPSAPSAQPSESVADPKIEAALATLDAADRRVAERQKFCPILPQSRLGSMGTPLRLTLEGQTVFVCCAGCTKAAKDKPKETLKKVAALQTGKKQDGDKHAASA
ncbi:MAG: efflux RND transporter periplasmic adaptor subunit, partial [Bdellovibrionales bacterium]|nr:efflux RND transporter periplasmic adaptor subunit [Bdellovibrionales bacterium]